MSFLRAIASILALFTTLADRIKHERFKREAREVVNTEISKAVKHDEQKVKEANNLPVPDSLDDLIDRL